MTRKISTGLRNAILGSLSTGDGSVRDIMDYGWLDIYSGSQPVDADTAESGTKLATITDTSGAFTPGVTTNGLRLGTAASASMSICSGQTWSGNGIADGTAGWFRYYANDASTGASTTSKRIDGSCTLTGGGGQLIMTTLSIVTSVPVTVSSFTVTASA